MSKVSEAKRLQNYQEKPLQKRCRTCKRFRSNKHTNKYGYDIEDTLRCGTGGFAVKPNAVCDIFVALDDN